MSLQEDLVNRTTEFDARKLADLVIRNNKLREELLDCLLNDAGVAGSRAAWVLSHCHNKDPGVIKPYEARLIGLLEKQGLHNGIIRNILRIYQTQPVPEKHSAFMLDTCYGYLRNATQPPAIRAFSITVIFNISQKHPELLDELKLTLLDIASHDDTQAMKTRTANTLKAMTRVKKEQASGN